MKAKHNKFGALGALLIALALLLGACSPASVAGDVKDEVNKLVDLYTTAATAASDYQACVDTVYLDINLQFDAANRYLDSNVAQVKAWKDNAAKAKADYEASKAAIAAAGGDPKKIDLSNPAVQPNGVGGQLSLYISALTENAPAAIPPEVTVNQQRIISSDTLTLRQCAKDWNAAALAYNQERQHVGPDIVAAAATRLGYRDLPFKLDQYQGSDASRGPIGDPRKPTAAPAP